MVLVLLIISIVIVIIGVKKGPCTYDNRVLVLGTLLTVIFGAIALILSIQLSSGMIIDDKINLYEAENAKIDNTVCAAVKSYKDYEKSTFESIKNKDTTTFVTLFPELKSDSLVKKQIEIYNDNREQIKELKLDKLELRPLRWWLYFGG